VTRPAAAGDMPIKAPMLAAGPMDWTGFFVGGHMGGGYSDDNWSDPFGSTAIAGGFTDVAGFGDTTHATGPLGGGQIGTDWQIGRVVMGIQADASAADLRGENTCFSGLGGINCQHTVNALGTITGRVGYAWDRSLVYVKGGGAWTVTGYDLLANTNVLKLGTGSADLDSWGWTVGGGIEYALTNHWTALVEYDHIGVPTTVVAFPTVATIDTATISVKQTVDLFKLGVNYRFNFASLQTIAARD
jgi:opacity protein-like surface antigen